MTQPTHPQSITALVPIKSRHQCKTRLAPHLTPTQRLLLVRAMLRKVLGVLQQCEAIGRVIVLTPEQDELPDVVECLRDQGWDLNSSLRAALRKLQIQDEHKVLILPADLACLRPEDIHQLASKASEFDVVIAPSDDELGTNALLLTPGTPFQLCFGHDSYQQHLHQISTAGLSCTTVKTAGLGFDIDSGDDLARLTALLTPQQPGLQPAAINPPAAAEVPA